MPSVSDSTFVASPSATSNAAKLLPEQSGLLSIGAVSRLYGVSICKLRLATRSGQLECVRLPNLTGGDPHRRFSPAHICQWLRVEEGSRENSVEGSNAPAGLRVGLMARV